MGIVNAALGFMNADGVVIDTQRPGDVLRAPTRPLDEEVYQALESHQCNIIDCSTSNVALSLETMGFDTVDLSSLPALQAVLHNIRQANSISRQDISAIRRELWGKKFRLTNGKHLRVLFIADEGIILRKSGPNGLKVNTSEITTEMNGHDAAAAVHSDQDVRGTPVKQILRGAAPLLFRHEAPDGFNRQSPVFLVNMWIPLQQVTRPLALMDNQTIDRKKHQLRYALPTDSFLKREESRRLNDIWAFLHDEKQQWYFTSDMNASTAYVFNTLCTPHGAFIAPGEDTAEALYLKLQHALSAMNGADANALLACTATTDFNLLPDDTTMPLRQAIYEMLMLLNEAHEQAEKLCTTHDKNWHERAEKSMDRVVRKSIEMRLVAWVS